jgi:hypothetical protein
MNQRKMESTLVLFDKKNFKENWYPMFKIMFPLKRKKFSGYLILYASKRKRRLEGLGKPRTKKASEDQNIVLEYHLVKGKKEKEQEKRNKY